MNQDPEISSSIQAALAPLDRARDHVTLMGRDGPEPESKAASDSRRPLGELPFIYAVGRLAVAGDHLLAWRELHRKSHQPIYAHLTLLRTALETASTARWILAGHTADERIGRAGALQAHDLRRRAQLEESLGITETNFKGKGKAAAFRVRQHEMELRKANIAIVRPSMTELVRDFARDRPLPNKSLYQLLSAFGHGELVSMMASELGPPQTTRVPRSAAVRVTGNDGMSRDITQLVSRTFSIGALELDRYAGAAGGSLT